MRRDDCTLPTGLLQRNAGRYSWSPDEMVTTIANQCGTCQRGTVCTRLATRRFIGVVSAYQQELGVPLESFRGRSHGCAYIDRMGLLNKSADRARNMEQ